jgi:leucyl aminopeptidase (aminopeptidase T)
MIDEKKLLRAARTALTQCLAVKDNEKILIVANPETRRIGEALYKEGVKLSAQTALFIYPKGTINGEEPPPLVADAMVKSDVIVAPTVMSVTHTAARRRAVKAGARMATMPGITEDFFVRGLSANYAEIQRVTRKIHGYLDRASVAHVTSPSGTDVVLDIRNPAVVSDGNLQKKGVCTNLPTGETELAPRNAKGILVVDRCGDYITEPTRLELKDGYLISFEGNASGRRFKRLIEEGMKRDGNQNASFIAEFAIGTNKSARVNANVLESEKVFGTCHFGFGNNMSYPGGRNESTLHIDTIVLKPTITLDGITIMKNGKLTI